MYYSISHVNASYKFRPLLIACFILNIKYHEGHAVGQLVAALRYKPEGRGFDPRWCQWNFSLT